MLKLEKITKDYKVADTKVEALRGVSIYFRENEFVSVLGPSGCGKTTLLNIIGGLDKYTSGDMSLNGRSTKEFKDRDWDVYRNHQVGFVFQSYNLIPHQTALGNVELALTISGMSKAERAERAKKILDEVGLSNQYDKYPNQLSGGQCQRVAIARALVNDPDILLADEPTGALDTVTSKQIMDLIKKIAKERLVIMVTHNPELAEEYSTRIIRLLDGKLQKDSNPYDGEKVKKEKPAETAATVQKQKAKMSFFTAFKLSLKNLFTKKRRSLMTCVAGSIGIIGVSLVLSISYGLQSYINNMQNDMLSGNPIEITETAFDINSLMGGSSFFGGQAKFLKENGWINVDSMMQQLHERSKQMENLFVQNNITKEYVEYIKAMPQEYVASTMLDYGLDVSNNIYTDFTGGDGITSQISLSAIRAIYGSILGDIKEVERYASMIGSLSASFAQAPDTRNTRTEQYVLSQYNILDGSIAKEKNEVMLVLGKDRTVTDLLLAQLGYYTQEQFLNQVNKLIDKPYNKEMYEESIKIKYEDIVGKTFTWYPNDTVFTVNSPTSVTYNAYYPGDVTSPELLPDASGETLEIVGIIEPKEKLNYGMLESGFYYTTELAEYIVAQNWESDLAVLLRDAEASSVTSMAVYMPEDSFYPGSPATTVYTGITYAYKYYFGGTSGDDENDATGLVGHADQMQTLLSMFMGGGGGGGSDISILATATYSLQQAGGNVIIDYDDDDVTVLGTYTMPNRMAIYPVDFTQKDKVLAYLDAWNGDGDIFVNGVKVTDREKITYTDMLSLIIGMIKTLLQIITVALVGFTSLALVVSCVMIGIITYVSVVERIKEIGVIRSLGGRKRDVSNLFIAETFILGFTAGMIGIVMTYLLSGIINLIVGSFGVISTIALFPIHYALVMLLLSIGLNLISGLMPSRAAAKKDPAVALRTE